MSNFDSINDALDIECVPEQQVHSLLNVSDETSVELKSEDTKMQDKDKDYQYARAQLYSLIEKGQEAVNGAL